MWKTVIKKLYLVSNAIIVVLSGHVVDLYIAQPCIKHVKEEFSKVFELKSTIEKLIKGSICIYLKRMMTGLTERSFYLKKR